MPVLLVITLAYYLGSGEVYRALYGKRSIIAYGPLFLRGFCLGLVLPVRGFPGGGVFQALGKGKYALIFALIKRLSWKSRRFSC